MQRIFPTDDTIVAISTPPGRSGIGVVRISGPQAESIAATFLKTRRALVSRRATLGTWAEDSGSSAVDVVDEVVATLFKAPGSYTGEDILEISAHGNPFILGRIVESARGAGARLAQPGEFTMRAVLNGKLDLLQAEALRNFIDAQTEAQARTALLQMGGSLSRRIVPTKERLVDIIAHLEAGIDFADDDVQPPDSLAIARRLADVRDELLELQKSYSYGKLLAIGLRLAIVGKPNVGKSSLFNRIVGANRAIVTNIPGTTRDVLSETISRDGIPLRFLDTAGLHDTEDPVERIGVERTMETLSEADLVLAVLDGASGLDDRDRNVLSCIQETAHIVVLNKCDLPQADGGDGGNVAGPAKVVRVSAKTGEGMDLLQQAIREFLETRAEGVAGLVLTDARQFERVSGAFQALEKAHAAILQGTPHEMVLLDIYAALTDLNELTGDVVTEDILGRIFSTFCVGK